MKLKSKLLLLGIVGAMSMCAGKVSAQRVGVNSVDLNRFVLKKYSNNVRTFANSASAADFIRQHYNVVRDNGNNILEGVRIRGKILIKTEMRPAPPKKGQTETHFEVVTSHWIRG